MAEDDEEETKKDVKLIGIFVTIPFVLAVPPVVGWLIGSFIDKHAGTAPWIMYVLVILGVIAGFRETFRIVKKYGGGDGT